MATTGRTAAALWAAIAAAAALAAAVLVSFFPPPSTFASVYPPEHQRVRPGRFTVPACNGLECRLCPYECFLPEGAVGRCKVRVNYGGRIKTLVYPAPAAAKK